MSETIITRGQDFPGGGQDVIGAKTVALICAAVASASGKSLSQLKFLSIRRAAGAQGAAQNSGTANRFKGVRRVGGARCAWARSAAAQIISDRQRCY